MAVHVSSSGGAGASAASTIQISSLQNIHNSISTLQEDALRNSQVLPEFVSNYFATSHQIRDFFAALEDFLNSTNLDPSLTQGVGETLAAFDDFLAQVTVKLACAYVDQLEIGKAQHLHGRRLDRKLDLIARWKTCSAVFFLGGAAIGSAAAVVAVDGKPRRVAAAAAAAAASVLFIGVGKWIDSLLEERENAVQKHKDIVTAMIVAGKIGIINLRAISRLVSALQYDAASASRLVDDEATEADVRTKMAALKQSFHELQREANRCSSGVSSAGETVLQSIITNLE